MKRIKSALPPVSKTENALNFLKEKKYPDSLKGPISSDLYKFKNPTAKFSPNTELEPVFPRSYRIRSDPTVRNSTAPRDNPPAHAPQDKTVTFLDPKSKLKAGRFLQNGPERNQQAMTIEKNGGFPLKKKKKNSSSPSGTALLLLPYPDALSL